MKLYRLRSPRPPPGSAQLETIVSGCVAMFIGSSRVHGALQNRKVQVTTLLVLVGGCGCGGCLDWSRPI